MARPPLPCRAPGETIRTEQLGPNRHCARARFRDYDGKTRDVEATGTTGPAATRALKEKLRDRVAPNDDEITRETYVNTLADLWIEEDHRRGTRHAADHQQLPDQPAGLDPARRG